VSAHQEPTTALQLPRLPVFGLAALAGKMETRGSVACVTDRRPFVWTTSARAAFFHGLRALGVAKGDRILLPTYHCPTMVSPVVQLGAVPVFYPIGRDGLPRPDFLARCDTGRVKGLLAAHFFGLPLRLDGVREFCTERSIALIEDCAHAYFGEIGGRPLGLQGDLALASLPKFFPVPEGGCLVGPENLLTRTKLAAPPLLSDARCLLDLVELRSRYRAEGLFDRSLRAVFDMKNRLKRSADSAPEARASEKDGADPWLAEPVLHRRATRVVERVVRGSDGLHIAHARQRNYRTLSSQLAGLTNARPLVPALPAGAVPYVFPLEVDDPDPLYSDIRAAGIPVFRWDQLWPATPAIAGDEGTRWSRHVLQIGCHQDLTESDVRTIAAMLRNLISRKR